MMRRAAHVGQFPAQPAGAIVLARLPECPAQRAFLREDALLIAKWVPSAAALALVSGDTAPCLNSSIIQAWIARSLAAIVLADPADGAPVAFCTLSRQESPGIEPGAVEVCHLVVAPERRYLFVANRLLKHARAISLQLGFERIYGRVVPQNAPALALAQYARFVEVPSGDRSWLAPGFRWFRSEITSRWQGLTLQ